MSTIVTYRPDQRPDVEVEVDGAWYPGELRQWKQLDDEYWSANVTWRRKVGESRIDNFPGDRVREAPETRRAS